MREMMKTSVSVIMPCYNDGAYIAEAVASIDLPGQPDVELIVIDDGSDDARTIEALKGLSGERIRVLHTAHIGPSGARNEGIRHAAGAYILPLDADDRIDAAYIRRAQAVLEREPEVGVVYCHADLFGERKGRWDLPDYSFERMLVENLVFVTAMFRRADWEAVGGFRTDMKEGMEDYDFFIGMLALGRKIVQLPETYFHYRIKVKSRTTGFMKDPEAIRRAYQRIYDHHEAFFREHAAAYERALRSEMIQQRFEKEQVLRSLEWLDSLRQIEPLKRLAKRLLRKKTQGSDGA